MTGKLKVVKLLSLLLSYFDIIIGDEDNFRVARRDSLSPDSAAEDAARKGRYE